MWKFRSHLRFLYWVGEILTIEQEWLEMYNGYSTIDGDGSVTWLDGGGGVEERDVGSGILLNHIRSIRDIEKKWQQ